MTLKVRSYSSWQEQRDDEWSEFVANVQGFLFLGAIGFGALLIWGNWDVEPQSSSPRSSEAIEVPARSQSNAVEPSYSEPSYSEPSYSEPSYYESYAPAYAQDYSSSQSNQRSEPGFYDNRPNHLGQDWDN